LRSTEENEQKSNEHILRSLLVKHRTGVADFIFKQVAGVIEAINDGKMGEQEMDGKYSSSTSTFLISQEIRYFQQVGDDSILGIISQKKFFESIY